MSDEKHAPPSLPTSFSILETYRPKCPNLASFPLADLKRWAPFTISKELVAGYEKDKTTADVCDLLESSFSYEQNVERRNALPDKDNPPIAAYRGEDLTWPRYVSTKRPKTNMLNLCSGQQNKQEKDTLYLPVVRYPGAYHTEEKKQVHERQSTTSTSEFCGTFYFIEPESSVLLNLGKTAVFGSKLHALWTLTTKENRRALIENLFQIVAWQNVYETVYGKSWKSWTASTLSESEWTVLVHQYVIPYYFALIRSDSRIPTIEFRSLQGTGTKTKLDVKKRRIEFEETGAYLCTLTPLYPTLEQEGPHRLFGERNFKAGVHDFMDQALCEAGRQAGLDTILLQHEVGQQDAVSEILDLRQGSYAQCHVETKRGPTTWYVPSSKYPKVWFLEQGFIVNQQAGRTRFYIDEDHWNQVVMY